MSRTVAEHEGANKLAAEEKRMASGQLSALLRRQNRQDRRGRGYAQGRPDFSVGVSGEAPDAKSVLSHLIEITFPSDLPFERGNSSVAFRVQGGVR